MCARAATDRSIRRTAAISHMAVARAASATHSGENSPSGADRAPNVSCPDCQVPRSVSGAPAPESERASLFVPAGASRSLYHPRAAGPLSGGSRGAGGPDDRAAALAALLHYQITAFQRRLHARIVAVDIGLDDQLAAVGDIRAHVHDMDGNTRRERNPSLGRTIHARQPSRRIIPVRRRPASGCLWALPSVADALCN